LTDAKGNGKVERLSTLMEELNDNSIILCEEDTELDDDDRVVTAVDSTLA